MAQKKHYRVANINFILITTDYECHFYKSSLSIFCLALRSQADEAVVHLNPALPPKLLAEAKIDNNRRRLRAGDLTRSGDHFLLIFIVLLLKP